MNVYSNNALKAVLKVQPISDISGRKRRRVSK